MANKIPAVNSVPHEADLDPHPIYFAVGAAIDGWEIMEEQFSVLYSIFVGKAYTQAGMQEYGDDAKRLSFRLQRLKVVAEAYFVSAPDQANEGTLAKLKGQMDYLMIARHRIAHGRLKAVLTTPPGDWKSGDMIELVPCYFWTIPIHAVSTLEGEIFGGYGSAEILRLRDLFLRLSNEIQQFCHRLAPPP